MATRFIRLAIVVGLLASACVPSTGTTTTTDSATTTTTVGTTTTTVPEDDITPPATGDPDDVASDAFWAAGDFLVVEEPTLFEEDALTAIERWLPADLIEGFVWEVYTRSTGANVLAVSVIPSLAWRGDPNFVPSLVETLADADALDVGNGMYRAETPVGLVVTLWSTGDGFVIAASLDEGLALHYLEALSAETAPHTVWESGSCLYIDPETESLPYAPFPPDIVAPCEGPHNAEVLLSLQVGSSLINFDAATIEYDRNYVCDKAYADAFGPQKDRTPMLITYMPDEDEWERGDRYLACVVQLQTIAGPMLFSGAMADRTDLEWDPDVGVCLDVSFAPEEVDCSVPHGYQYVGDVAVAFDEWPEHGPRAFDESCDDLLSDFVLTGPADVEVVAIGLYPFAFEGGDRTARCMAFAVEEGFLAEVIGAFDGPWRIVGGGIAA